MGTFKRKYENKTTFSRKEDRMFRENKPKEYETKGGTFTIEELKNPTSEMKKDIWWRIAHSDWEMDTGQAKFFNTAEEVLNDLYGDEEYEL
jgi:hypothetical protein